MSEAIYIKHRRTHMYVARQEPKNNMLRSYITQWRWVRNAADATAFTKQTAIHPVIQMGIEANALAVDSDDNVVPGIL